MAYKGDGTGRAGPPVVSAETMLNFGEPDPALHFYYDRGSSYESETRVTEALRALIPEEELVHPDQRFFQIVHVATEYFWYGMHYELRRIIRALDTSRYAEAAELLQRTTAMAEVPVALVKLMIQRLTQYSLLQMRRSLPEDATGFDSPGAGGLRRIAAAVWRAFEHALERYDLTPATFALHRMEKTDAGEELDTPLAWLAQVYEELEHLDGAVMEWRQLHMHLAWGQVGGAPHGEVPEGRKLERPPQSLRGRPVSDLERISVRPFFPELWGIPNVIFDAMTDEEATAAYLERVGRAPHATGARQDA